MGESIWFIDAVARETMLFAAIGLLIGGLDDMLVDLVFLVGRVRRGGHARLTIATLPPPRQPGRIAVFVAAWDEVAVIGNMLVTAVERFDHPDYRIYVGLYPNDRATIDAAAAVAARDPRIRLVIGARDGPTTKADCLNTLWRAQQRDDARTRVATKAIVLHDAEDVVHADELRIFDALIERHDYVQLPVLPLVKRGAQLVSGHYADEFAEAHAKQLVVRTALGAGMPLAGTGCAIAPDILALIAAERGGDPFDASSLTEDYELGLRMADLGARGLFVRIDDARGGIVAVRAFFPDTIDTAVRQKTRWMTGIALSGWDRTGWARPLAFADHWMRMRDRRAPLAVVVLATAYCALPAWALAAGLHWYRGSSATAVGSPGLWLLVVNTALLAWRLATRMLFTGRSYGLREALWSLPRFVVGNFVALNAAPRALVRYIGMLRGAAPVWDKTRHEFPDAPAMANADVR
ncbi:glycosyl transferase family protein [Sphingomonas ginsenosidivorax]|uniref:Glycosyl transferase family protein n=1 Tax=Sphingomonas ginsenosidivorax TaxID=862135 RepID=A0A5C6UH97_9SPHN|nr:glycosyl transferase family protein [Sphingomonas ginsenosidivorax]TXC72172.1 glycosyl transferase family protein [Sphingomonas ginsenosidivorax]